jgi:hypothetical protein
LRPDVEAGLVMCRVYFGEKIEDTMAPFRAEISEEGFLKQVAACLPKSRDLQGINDVQVVSIYTKQAKETASTLLSEMHRIATQSNKRLD